MRNKRSISLIGRLAISHLLVAGVAFQSGVAVSSAACNKLQQETIQPNTASNFQATFNGFAKNAPESVNRKTEDIARGLQQPSPFPSTFTPKPQSQPQERSDTKTSRPSVTPTKSNTTSIQITTKMSTSSLQFQPDNPDIHPSASKNFVHGVAWTKQTSFQKFFDLGYPLEDIPGSFNDPNQYVLLLYLDQSSRPTDYKAQHDLFRTIPNAQLATENCQELQVVIVKQKNTRYEKDMGRHQKCVAIMPHWGPAAHVHRFSRPHPETNANATMAPVAKKRIRRLSDLPQLEYVNHMHRKINKEAYHFNKVFNPKLVKEAWGRFANYVQHYESALKELTPVLQKAASGSAAQSSFGPGSKDSKGVIVVMVTNVARIQFLINYVCAAKAIQMDLSNLIVFCLDTASYQAARALELQAYYNPNLFPIPSSGKAETGEFGDLRFARIMIAKVYSVHLVNTLGYDVLFMDTDVIPLQPEIVDYFADRWLSASSDQKKDIYLQYDKNERFEQAPFSANSGFYFVKHNWKTQYFFETFVRMEEMILRVQSHQQVMIHLLSEFQSLVGLKVKVMGGYGEDANLFPNGWHFTRKKGFKDDLREGKERPYIFHANWNSDGKEKQSQLQEVNLWFVKNTTDDQCSVVIGNQESSKNAKQSFMIPPTLTKDNCCSSVNASLKPNV